MVDQNLGPRAESDFRRLCLQSDNLTIHESQSAMDRTGWDFLIEFPWLMTSQLPADILPAPIRCKIQVKGTKRERRKENIKLTNMHFLIKEQMPVFFCFIEYGEQKEPQFIYLVHVGEKIIKRTLERIRKNETKAQPDPLNEHHLTISYNDDHKLESIAVQCLKDRIQDYIPNTLETYIQIKNKNINTLGFENGKYTITYTVNENNIEAFVDSSLRYSDKKIPVEDIIVRHTRFGVHSHSKDSGPGIISFPKPPESVSISRKPRPIELIFKDKDFSLGVQFPAEMYASPFHAWIPDDYKKVRIISIFGDLFLKSDGNIEVEFHLPLNERLPLGMLRNLLNLLEMIEKQSNLIQLALKRETKTSICCDISDCLVMSFNHDVRGYFDLKEVAQCLESLAEICKRQSHLEEQLLLSFVELSSLRSSGDFLLISKAICKGEETFALYSADIEKCGRNSRTGYICSAIIFVGNKLIAGCFGIIGSINSDGNGHFLRSENILIDNFFAIDAKQTISKECIDQSNQNLKLAMVDQDLDHIFIQVVA